MRIESEAAALKGLDEAIPTNGAAGAVVPVVQQPASTGLSSLFSTVTNFFKSPIGIMVGIAMAGFFAYKKGYITKEEVFGKAGEEE